MAIRMPSAPLIDGEHEALGQQLANQRGTARRRCSGAPRSRAAGRSRVRAAGWRCSRTRSPGSDPPSPSGHTAASSICVAAYPVRPRPRRGATPEGWRVERHWPPSCVAQAVKGAASAALGLRHRHARPQPSHHFEPVKVRVSERFLASFGSNRTFRAAAADRGRAARRIDAEELRRCYADDGERQVIDQDLLADRIRGGRRIDARHSHDCTTATLRRAGRSSSLPISRPAAGDTARPLKKFARHVMGVGELSFAADHHIQSCQRAYERTDWTRQAPTPPANARMPGRERCALPCLRNSDRCFRHRPQHELAAFM